MVVEIQRARAENDQIPKADQAAVKVDLKKKLPDMHAGPAALVDGKNILKGRTI